MKSRDHRFYQPEPAIRIDEARKLLSMRYGWWILCLCLIGCSSPTAPESFPNYAGAWQGDWTITSCVESGTFIGGGFCAGYGPPVLIAFTIEQFSTIQGSDTPAVTGTVRLVNQTGALQAAVAGVVIPLGSHDLSVHGLTTQNGATFDINSLTLHLEGRELHGDARFILSATGGSVNMVGTVIARE
jgi:hypothetical protein